MSAQTKRAAARIAAVQALYQAELTGDALTEVAREHHRYWQSPGAAPRFAETLGPIEPKLFRNLLVGARQYAAAIDAAIQARLKAGWPIHRLDPVLRATLRTAGAELLQLPETPTRVVLSEYVKLTEAFGANPAEIAFANGVLQGVAGALRPDPGS